MASRFFVRGRHEDDVPLQRTAFGVQREEGLQMEDPARLGVEGPAAVHVAVPDLATERIHRPVIVVRRDDVDVVQEQDRRLVAPLEPRPDVAPARRRLGGLVVDSGSIEDLREELDTSGLVARRVRRIDADVLLKDAHRVRRQGLELGLACGRAPGDQKCARCQNESSSIHGSSNQFGHGAGLYRSTTPIHRRLPTVVAKCGICENRSS